VKCEAELNEHHDGSGNRHQIPRIFARFCERNRTSRNRQDSSDRARGKHLTTLEKPAENPNVRYEKTRDPRRAHNSRERERETRSAVRNIRRKQRIRDRRHRNDQRDAGVEVCRQSPITGMWRRHESESEKHKAACAPDRKHT
jgi:hypothetical protein